MSRSNPNEQLINPAKRWLRWDSDNKCFKYFDKEAPHPTDPTKKGNNIMVQLPLQFLVLDTLHKISGFSDADSAGIYSNEVRDLKKQQISAKIKKVEQIKGLYEDIKGKVTGARYAQSVYIGYFDENKELQVGNIELTGSSLGPWIEFCKKHKPTEGAIKVVTTNYVEKNKKVNWNEPVFEAIVVKPETDAKAVAADKILQEYLTAYFDNAKVETTPVTEVAVEHAPEMTNTEALFGSSAPVTTGGNVIDDDF